MDERSWEPITSAPHLRTPHQAGKGMTSSHVGQASAYTKHHGSARTSYRDISRPTLGLDLRFEQTYLKSIAPHVRLTTPAPDENEKRGDVMRLQGQQLDIKWGQVIWITTKDQILAPLFQGMLWWAPYSSPLIPIRGIYVLPAGASWVLGCNTSATASQRVGVRLGPGLELLN